MSSPYENPIKIHLSRAFAVVPGQVTMEDKFVTGNQVQGWGISHTPGNNGYRVIVKVDEVKYEVHRNKNTDLFKQLDKTGVIKANWVRDGQKWFTAEESAKLSEASYR